MRAYTVAIALVLFLFGCGGGGDNIAEGEPEKIWVTIDSGLTKVDGSTVTLYGKASCPDCPPSETSSSNTTVPSCPLPSETPNDTSKSVSLSWTNQTTGLGGEAADQIFYTCGCGFVSGVNFCTSSYSRQWTATIPIVVGTNNIEITASNQSGNSSSASTTIRNAPEIPSNVTTSSEHGQIVVAWNTVADATSYNIYWSTSPDFENGTGTKIKGVFSPFTHTGLSDNDTYYYRITALAGDVESAPSAIVWGTVGWTHEDVTSAPLGGLYIAITTDTYGTPHMIYSYYDDATSMLRMYLTNAQGTWASMLVSSSLAPFWPSLNILLDSDNSIHLNYIGSSGRVKYTTYSFGNWATEDVDSISGQCATAFALDSSGAIHVAAMSYTGLTYSHKISGVWQTDSVTTFVDNYSCGKIGVGIDSGGFAHIVYAGDFPNNTLKVATNETGSWVISEVDSIHINEMSTAMDANGKIHIIYTDTNNYGGLYYANNVSGSWQLETIFGQGNVASPSLAIDNAGHAYVAIYADKPSGYITKPDETEILYINNFAQGWKTTIVDKTVSDFYLTYSDTSISVDQQGTVHIAYIDGRDGQLKYSTNK